MEPSTLKSSSLSRARGARVAGNLLPGDSAPVVPIHPEVSWTCTLALVSLKQQQQQQQASDSSVPTPSCCVTFVARWTLAGSPSQELPSVGEGDDCVLLGGMSSSRSPRPLPRFHTTQLHGDRRRQGHGEGPEAPSPQEIGTQHFFLDDESVPELGGSRLDRLPAVSGPQERVPQRIVEQIVDSAPVVQLLHAPEPQLVDSVMEVRKILDNLLPYV